MSRLRLAADAHRLVCEPLTSGANYLRTLVSEWLKYPNAPELTLFVPQKPAPEVARDALFAGAGVRVRWPKNPATPTASYRAQFFWQQQTIPSLLKREPVDVYFSPFHLAPQRPLGLTIVTAIHDLCWLKERHWSLGSWIHPAQVWSACLRSQRLVCVSQFTYDMLAQWSPRFARKARAVPNGITSGTISPADAAERVRRLAPDLVPKQYVMWIGDPAAPRKRPDLLCASFKLHREKFPEHKLVLVAPQATHGQLRALARAEGVEPAVHLFSGIDNPARDALYRSALAMLFPSECEGFGYPVLEAMFQGCPPVCYREGPAREMVESLVPLAPELNARDFASVLRNFAAQPPSERERLVQDLIARASLFSASAMAQGTLRVLAEAVGRQV